MRLETLQNLFTRTSSLIMLMGIALVVLCGFIVARGRQYRETTAASYLQKIAMAEVAAREDLVAEHPQIEQHRAGYMYRWVTASEHFTLFAYPDDRHLRTFAVCDDLVLRVNTGGDDPCAWSAAR